MRVKASAPFLLVFLVLLGSFLPVYPIHCSTVETRYFRSDTATVNGLLSYKLLATNTATSAYKQIVDVMDSPYTCYWGVRVWKRSSAGVETEVTGGSAVAIVSRASVGSGVQSATWACPSTSLASTDSITIRVYCAAGTTPPNEWMSGATGDAWQSGQLGASSLDAATWTIYYYTYLSVVLKIGQYTHTMRFYFGTDTTYQSKITGFTWTAASTGQNLTFTNSEQLIVAASQSTACAKSLQATSYLTGVESIQCSAAKTFTSIDLLQLIELNVLGKALAFSASSLVSVLVGESASKALAFTGCDVVTVSDSQQKSVGLLFTFQDYALLVTDDPSVAKALEFQSGTCLIVVDNATWAVAKAFQPFELFDLVKIVDYVFPEFSLDLFDMAMNFFGILICVPFLLALGIVFQRGRRKKLEASRQT